MRVGQSDGHRQGCEDTEAEPAGAALRRFGEINKTSKTILPGAANCGQVKKCSSRKDLRCFEGACAGRRSSKKYAAAGGQEKFLRVGNFDRFSVIYS